MASNRRKDGNSTQFANQGRRYRPSGGDGEKCGQHGADHAGEVLQAEQGAQLTGAQRRPAGLQGTGGNAVVRLDRGWVAADLVRGGQGLPGNAVSAAA